MADKIAKYLTFFFLVVYWLQGILYPSGTAISQYSLLVVFIIGTFYFMKTFAYSGKNIFVVFMLLFTVLNIVYWAFSPHIYYASIIGKHETWQNLKDILFVFFLFFITYNISRANKISDKEMRIFLIVFAVMSIFMYFRILNETNLMRGGSISNMEITNNAGYLFVHLLPFLFLFKKNKFLQICLLLLCLCFVMMSIKRGAIIISVIFTLYYVYSTTKQMQNFKKYFWIIVILSIVIIIGYQVYDSSDYVQFRVENTLEGNASTRDFIYSHLWQYWYDSRNMLNVLFGFGFYSSYSIVGIEAHNDWLELLTTAGLLGVVIYLGLFYTIWKETKKDLSDAYKSVLFSILLIWFMKTLFSMGYNDTYMFPVFILLGYVCGKNIQIK
jgi:O-antigen ligase